jgi:hypothetical protein
MRRVMVRYTVKPGRAEENERLVRDVYDELHRTGPEGIRYATFRLADGVTFVHVASVETDDGRNPLADVAAFARFQEAVADRCDVAPVVMELTEVGSYRLLGEAIGA